MTEPDQTFNLKLSKKFYHVYTCVQFKKQNDPTGLIMKTMVRNPYPNHTQPAFLLSLALSTESRGVYLHFFNSFYRIFVCVCVYPQVSKCHSNIVSL